MTVSSLEKLIPNLLLLPKHAYLDMNLHGD